MSRKRAAFLFEYLSDLFFSLMFMYLGGSMAFDHDSLGWEIVGVIALIFAITYMQYSIKHLITGE